MKLPAAAALAALVLLPSEAHAFCGFFINGAGARLFNDATMVVLMREGTRTVLSMQNSYAGPPEDFAMVVPVPVVLKEENVKTLPREIFEKVDALSAPRLVEYWETDPCAPDLGLIGRGGGGGAGSGYGLGSGKGMDSGVVVEATFTVGEYEVVILSARDSTGLDGWLHDNGYKIPDGAEPYLRPYVAAGSKFFVAKVDVKKVTMKDGHALLSPLRFFYDTPDFTLPVRLGLMNSAGTQDLIVNILSRAGRFEVANYPNVFMPTNLDVTDATRDAFGAFYAALFDATMTANPGAVATEYAWSADSCDPCPTPPLADSELATLGADAIADAATATGAPAGPTRPEASIGEVRVDGGLAPLVARRMVRTHLNEVRDCYEKAYAANPALVGDATFELALRADGKVESAKAAASTLSDPGAADCIAGHMKAWVFPRPEGDRKTTVIAPYRFARVAVVSRGWRAGFTLTRLHARYGKDGLGEDLVFRSATSVTGGRETWAAAGKLATGAIPAAGASAFQARYVIRHPWTGAIPCKAPVRGRWGGAPRGKGAGVGAGPSVTPAVDSAHAPRGTVTLASFVLGGAPALPVATPAAATTTAAAATAAAAAAAATAGAGATAAAAATATAAASATDPGAAPSGCGCRLAARGGASPLLVLLAAALLYRRRFTRRTS